MTTPDPELQDLINENINNQIEEGVTNKLIANIINSVSPAIQSFQNWSKKILYDLSIELSPEKKDLWLTEKSYLYSLNSFDLISDNYWIFKSWAFDAGFFIEANTDLIGTEENIFSREDLNIKLVDTIELKSDSNGWDLKLFTPVSKNSQVQIDNFTDTETKYMVSLSMDRKEGFSNTLLILKYGLHTEINDPVVQVEIESGNIIKAKYWKTLTVVYVVIPILVVSTILIGKNILIALGLAESAKGSTGTWVPNLINAVENFFN